MSNPTENQPSAHLNKEEHRPTMREQIGLMRWAQVGLFVLAVGYTIFLIRPVLLPLIIALLLALVLKPVQRRLETLLRLPPPLAAFLVMTAATALGLFAIISLSQPVMKYAGQIRGEKFKHRLTEMAKPLIKAKAEISDVAEEVQKMTGTGAVPEGEQKSGATDGESGAAPGVTEDPQPPGKRAGVDDITEPSVEREKVGVSVSSTAPGTPLGQTAPKVDVSSGNSDLSVESADGEVAVETSDPPVMVEIANKEDPAKPLYAFAKDFAVDFLATVGLLFFLLAFGEIMIERMAEVDTAASLLEEIAQDVSYYLFSITLINLGLGFATGIAMWLLGMPNPVLWGVMAALLNYIPYLGAIGGTVIVLLVATVSFEQTRFIVLVPIVYYLLTAIEGNFVTPAIIGKRFTINPSIVFAWVLCWGAMWGVAGMLIALPLLMVFRIVCAKLPSLARLERVISM